MRQKFLTVLTFVLFLIIPFLVSYSEAQIKRPQPVNPTPGVTSPSNTTTPAVPVPTPLPVTKNTQPDGFIPEVTNQLGNWYEDFKKPIDKSNIKRKNWFYGICAILIVFTWLYCDYSLKRMTAKGPTPRKMFWYMILWIFFINPFLSLALSVIANEKALDQYSKAYGIICIFAIFLYWFMMIMAPKGRKA